MRILQERGREGGKVVERGGGRVGREGKGRREGGDREKKISMNSLRLPWHLLGTSKALADKLILSSK